MYDQLVLNELAPSPYSLITPRPTFTTADKDAALPWVAILVELANLARCAGILALEEAMQNNIHQDNLLLKTGLELIIDGTSPELVARILGNLIVSSGYTGEDLLKQFLCFDGVLMVQRGMNPRIITCNLLALLGQDYLQHIPVEDPTNSYVSQILHIFNGQEVQAQNPAYSAFNEVVSALGPRDIQLILREKGMLGVMEVALNGATSLSAYNVLMALSSHNLTDIYNNRHNLHNHDEATIVMHQQLILTEINRLATTGQVLIRPV